MEYINFDPEYEIPKTTEEVIEELDYLFFPSSRGGEMEASDRISGELNEEIRAIIKNEGGNVSDYDREYQNYIAIQMIDDYSKFTINKEAKLDYYQAMVDERLKICEVDGSYEVRDNPRIVAAVEQEVRSALNAEYANTAAINACQDYERLVKERGEETAINTDEIREREELEASEKQKAQMIERAEEMARKGELEYVVRGATLMCMCGSHTRHLDMYHSYGIYVNDKAVACKDDCIANQNISYFGHCNAPGCKLTETISLKVGSVVNTEGVALQDVQESIKVGKKCVPDFDGKWQNTHLTTLIAEDGGVIYRQVLTTASYLICKHGGLIYPITSGQIDEAYYYAAFQAYPYDDFGSEAFYNWCEKNNVCPAIAGRPEHAQWHRKKIDEAMKNYSPAKEIYQETYLERGGQLSTKSDPLASGSDYSAYLSYKDLQKEAQAAYENCLTDAKRVGSANMPSEEAKKYADILQDYLDSGVLEEYERTEVIDRYGEFLEVYSDTHQ